MEKIQITPKNMCAHWIGLHPDVTDWLKENKIVYDFVECDEQGRMFIILSQNDAMLFKLMWL